MSSQRWARRVAFVVLVVTIGAHAGQAVAWHGHHGHGHFHNSCTPPWPCQTPWPGVPCVYPSFGASGWMFDGCGLGVVRYRTFAYATPGFFCGWSVPSFVPALPGYGCGWYPYTPVLFRPSFNCYPGAFAPVFGPAGVYPFLGLASAGDTRTHGIARGPAGGVGQVVARPAAGHRFTNSTTRQRAARLVASGDRHLRAAVVDRAELRAALDAYRRAEAVASDEPDTFLRQAIVLAALDRTDDASVAVSRAAAIDGRLADPPASMAGGERLPFDPVFGDRPLGAASPLAERSAVLLAGIFGSDGSADAPNWIADLWTRRLATEVQLAARR